MTTRIEDIAHPVRPGRRTERGKAMIGAAVFLAVMTSWMVIMAVVAYRHNVAFDSRKEGN